MSLIINQYDNSETALNSLNIAKEDLIADIVFAIELGFTNAINERTFFHTHMLCFHYCVDFYEGEKNVSFNILSPHEETDEYFFEKYTCNFYKKDAKSKSIQIENAQLSIPMTKKGLNILENELFHDVIEKIKNILWNKHESILNSFKENGINYSDEEMTSFSQKLKSFIEVSYKKIEESELKPFIREYQASSLNAMLGEKDKSKKNFKL